MQQSVLRPMLMKLLRRSALDEEDQQAILSLPSSIKTLDAGNYIVREGEVPTRCFVLLEGLGYRHKIVINGARQIVGLHFPGDLLNLQSSVLQVADENVQALTWGKAAAIPMEALVELIDTRPAIGRAVFSETLVDASIFREWIANVGRRDAQARMAHFLCELFVRQREIGLARDDRFPLPMTQEQLADVLGLTSVHVNRTLKALEAAGLIERDKREVSFADWPALVSAGDFNPAYLHLGAAEKDDQKPLTQVERTAPSLGAAGNHGG